MDETVNKFPFVEFSDVSIIDEHHGKSLSKLNFTLEKGENLVILGPEGCGKDLILDLLIGKRAPDTGTVRVNNEIIHDKDQDSLETYRSKVGYVSFNYGLINNLTVLENILLPLRYHTRMSEEDLIEKAMTFLLKYRIDHKSNQRPQMLTYNETLRIAFIRALITDPELLLLDNALGGQCPLGLAKFMELAHVDIEAHHGSFILATFEAGYFYNYADRFMLLYKGENVFDGPVEELTAAANPYVRQYLYDRLKGPMDSFHEGLQMAGQK